MTESPDNQESAVRYPEVGTGWQVFLRSRFAARLSSESSLLFELFNVERGTRSRLGAVRDLVSIRPRSKSLPGDWNAVRTIFIVDSEIANSHGTLSPLIRRYCDEYPLGVVLNHRTRDLLGTLTACLPSTTLFFDADQWLCLRHSVSQALRNPTAAAALLRRFGPGVLCYLLTNAARADALRALSAAAGNLHNVIVGNERAHLSALALATWRGVARTICVQHGVPTAEYLPINVDYYWAWNPRFAEWFRARAPTTIVSVMGNPRESQRALLSRSRSGRSFKALLIGQPLGLDFPASGTLKILDLLLGFDNTDFELRVRLHPADSLAAYPLKYRQWLSNHLDSAVSFHEALHDADVVMSYASTGLFEAVEQGKPAIVIDPAPTPVASAELFAGFPRARSTAELFDALTFLKTMQAAGSMLPSMLRGLQAEILANRLPALLDEATIDRLCESAPDKTLT